MSSDEYTSSFWSKYSDRIHGMSLNSTEAENFSQAVLWQDIVPDNIFES